MQYPLIKPAYYLALLKRIIQFIKAPESEPDLQSTTRMKIYDTIGLFVLKIFALILLAILMGIVSSWFDPENISQSTMMERFNFPTLLLVGGFVLPLVEEIGFRLSLRFKPIYLAMTIAVFCYYILTKLVYHTSISMVDESFLLRASSSLILGLVVYPILSIKKIRSFLAQFWTRNVKWVYYISCLSFAWIHIFNYELSPIHLIFMPIITLPQLMSALINGYTRLAFGFQYPLLFHIANNVISMLLILLSFEDVIWI